MGELVSLAAVDNGGRGYVAVHVCTLKREKTHKRIHIDAIIYG